MLQWPVLVVATCVLVIASAAYYFSATPLAAPTIDTSNWNTYKNEKLGFEVRYPSDFQIRDDGFRSVAFIKKGLGPRPEDGFAVLVYGSSTLRGVIGTYLTLEESENFGAGRADEKYVVRIEPSSRIVNGTPWVIGIKTITLSDGTQPYPKEITAWAQRDRDVFEISARESRFDAIISTFRFTSQTSGPGSPPW